MPASWKLAKHACRDAGERRKMMGAGMREL
jgi:hypothetical protein